MKNRILILLIALVSLVGCDDAIAQCDYGDSDRCYTYSGTYTYTNKFVTWSGGQSKQLQAASAWCPNPNFSGGVKYDRYRVFFTGGFADWDMFEGYEGDKWVLQGTDPRNNANAFNGQGGRGYFFEHPDSEKTISAIEITASNGVAPKSSPFRNEVQCPTDIIENNNSVADNSAKIGFFYDNCGVPITNTSNVDIIDNRVWIVNQSIYFNGQNRYYRIQENIWIKVDTNGYIVDTVNVNCSTGDRLVCLGTATIPISSNSMITVSDLLGISQTYGTSLLEMGERISKAPPINFPDDFRNYKSNMYAYANGVISSVQGCGFTVPPTTQSQVLLWFESDKGIIGKMDFCGGGATLSVNLASGTTTKFVTIDFCDPPFSSKGEVRVSIRIEQNGTASTRRNVVAIRSDVFNMDIIITQLPGQ